MVTICSHTEKIIRWLTPSTEPQAKLICVRRRKWREARWTNALKTKGKESFKETKCFLPKRPNTMASETGWWRELARGKRCRCARAVLFR